MELSQPVGSNLLRIIWPISCGIGYCPCMLPCQSSWKWSFTFCCTFAASLVCLLCVSALKLFEKAKFKKYITSFIQFRKEARTKIRFYHSKCTETFRHFLVSTFIENRTKSAYNGLFLRSKLTRFESPSFERDHSDFETFVYSLILDHSEKTWSINLSSDYESVLCLNQP